MAHTPEHRNGGTDRPGGIATSEGMTFEHDGRRLAFDVYGEGDEVVLYLHGLLMDSRMNRGIARALAEQGKRVVLLDLLGHGRSDQPAHASEYRMDRYAEQVAGLLDHLHVDQAVLGGVSLGANVSLIFTERHPERVRGLVLEMPVLEWAVPAAAMLFAPMVVAARYAAPVLRVVNRVVRAVPRPPWEALDSLVEGGTVPPEVMAAVLHGILVGPVAPTVEERRSMDVPALVLAHTNDLIHPFDDAVNLSEQLPRADLVRSRSPLELRVLPKRLTGEISAFVDAAWARPAAA